MIRLAGERLPETTFPVGKLSSGPGRRASRGKHAEARQRRIQSARHRGIGLDCAERRPEEHASATMAISALASKRIRRTLPGARCRRWFRVGICIATVANTRAEPIFKLFRS